MHSLCWEGLASQGVCVVIAPTFPCLQAEVVSHPEWISMQWMLSASGSGKTWVMPSEGDQESYGSRLGVGVLGQ